MAKPVVANKRVDGTGFRETIWSVQKGRGEDAKTVKSEHFVLKPGIVLLSCSIVVERHPLLT